jgi:hypothetical protein
MRHRMLAELRRCLAGGRHDEALAWYESLASLEPREPRWRKLQGDLLRRLGRKAEAVECYDRAMASFGGGRAPSTWAAMAALHRGLVQIVQVPSPKGEITDFVRNVMREELGLELVAHQEDTDHELEFDDETTAVHESGERELVRDDSTSVSRRPRPPAPPPVPPPRRPPPPPPPQSTVTPIREETIELDDMTPLEKPPQRPPPREGTIELDATDLLPPDQPVRGAVDGTFVTFDNLALEAVGE